MTTPVLHATWLAAHDSRLREAVGGGRWTVSDHAVHCARTVATEMRRCPQVKLDYGVIIGVLGGMEIPCRLWSLSCAILALARQRMANGTRIVNLSTARRRHQFFDLVEPTLLFRPLSFSMPSSVHQGRKGFGVSLIRKKVRLRQCDNPQPP